MGGRDEEEIDPNIFFNTNSILQYLYSWNRGVMTISYI